MRTLYNHIESLHLFILDFYHLSCIFFTITLCTIGTAYNQLKAFTFTVAKLLHYFCTNFQLSVLVQWCQFINICSIRCNIVSIFLQYCVIMVLVLAIVLQYLFNIVAIWYNNKAYWCILVSFFVELVLKKLVCIMQF